MHIVAYVLWMMEGKCMLNQGSQVCAFSIWQFFLRKVWILLIHRFYIQAPDRVPLKEKITKVQSKSNRCPPPSPTIATASSSSPPHAMKKHQKETTSRFPDSTKSLQILSPSVARSAFELMNAPASPNFTWNWRQTLHQQSPANEQQSPNGGSTNTDPQPGASGSQTSKENLSGGTQIRWTHHRHKHRSSSKQQTCYRRLIWRHHQQEKHKRTKKTPRGFEHRRKGNKEKNRRYRTPCKRKYRCASPVHGAAQKSAPHEQSACPRNSAENPTQLTPDNVTPWNFQFQDVNRENN